MAKKRKQRSSNPDTTIAPDSQTMQLEEPQEPVMEGTKEDPNGEDNEQEIQEEAEESEELEEEAGEEVEEEDSEEDDEEEGTKDQRIEQHTLDGLTDQSANGAKQMIQSDDLDDTPLETLLEPFGKEQLIGLIKKAASVHPGFSRFVHEVADADPAHRKIFVHGLSWDTTSDILTNEFEKYGEIEELKAVTDRVSGKSKGYAFILYKHRSGARRALQQPQKKILNRVTSCQLASQGPVPGAVSTALPVSEYTQRKIFVSNVAPDLDPSTLLEFFSKFGEVEEGPLGLDKMTGKPKGFVLFVYKTVDGARRALEEPHKNFEGHVLHCQRAVDGPKTNKPVFGGSVPGVNQQAQLQFQPQYHLAKKGKYLSGGTGTGHLMAPSGPTPVGFNPAMGATGFNPGVTAAAQGLNPALGQALTALLATQGASLGLGNLLGGIGGAPVNQGAPATGYGNQVAGPYANQMAVQGGYQNPQMGQSSAARPQPGGGAQYMGH